MDILGIRITRISNKINQKQSTPSKAELIRQYLSGGRVPWSIGYIEHKWETIVSTINNEGFIIDLKKQRIFPKNFGIGIDERVVEYPWIFSNLLQGPGKVLDAGSTFNFQEILDHNEIANKELSILTYHPEAINFNARKISYLYSDLRNIPFRDNYFDQVISQSTIEHIDKDNSIYGYSTPQVNEQIKSYEYLLAIKEMIRVTKVGGSILVTFPFGKFEDHGFFQQFDTEMLEKLEKEFQIYGTLSTDFMLYSKAGWQFANIQECSEAESYNPHTGRGKGEDGAAHCRCICVIKFVKTR